MKKKLTLIQAIVGIVVGVILFVAVAIPISISVIGTVNWVGYTTSQTVAQIIPLSLAVGAIVLVFSNVAGGI